MSDVPRSLQSWVQLFKRSYSQLTFFNFFYKHTWYQVYFSIPFILSSPFYSLSLLVVTQIRGHIASPSAPSPLRLAPRTFIARRLQLFLLSPTSVEYYKTEKYIPGTQVHLHSQPNNSATTQTKHTRYIPRHRPVNNLLGRLQQNDNKNNTCQWTTADTWIVCTN